MTKHLTTLGYILSYIIRISEGLLISNARIASLEKIKLCPRVTSTSLLTALKNANFLAGSNDYTKFKINTEKTLL